MLLFDITEMTEPHMEIFNIFWLLLYITVLKNENLGKDYFLGKINGQI